MRLSIQPNGFKAPAKRLLHRVVAFSLLVFLCSPYSLAQDETSGWPGFNADNTVRGTVTAAEPNSFVLRTDDGIVYKVLYSVNSRFFSPERGSQKPADVHNGDMLIATGNVDNAKKTVGAAVLIGVPAEEVRKAREGLGKTWTAGKITSISLNDEPRITLARLDGVTQTIAVDENTSFKRHHESITLADIKSGEALRADGHVVGKTFVAATVNVFIPGHNDPLSGSNENGHP